MARLLLQHLRSKGCPGAVLLNRTLARAESLASDFPDLPVQCRPLEDLDHCLSTCSLVFTSTAAEEPMITRERLGKLNRRSALMLIDIGVPRNISGDVAGLPGVRRRVVARLELAQHAGERAHRAVERTQPPCNRLQASRKPLIAKGEVVDAHAPGERCRHPLDHRFELQVAAEGAAAPIARDDRGQ
jgi:hypothetical protein